MPHVDDGAYCTWNVLSFNLIMFVLTNRLLTTTIKGLIHPKILSVITQHHVVPTP